LDAIIDMNHALVQLARTIDWAFLEQKFGAVYEDKPGRLAAALRVVHEQLFAPAAVCRHRRSELIRSLVDQSWAVLLGDDTRPAVQPS
ncbi:hypothetical protein ACWKUA_46515, partial [Bradyrhizobium sp. LeoA1S1]